MSKKNETKDVGDDTLEPPKPPDDPIAPPAPPGSSELPATPVEGVASAAEPEEPKLGDYNELHFALIRDAYARYIKTISIRERPKDPLVFDELSGEKRLGWLVAVFG